MPEEKQPNDAEQERLELAKVQLVKGREEQRKTSSRDANTADSLKPPVPSPKTTHQAASPKTRHRTTAVGLAFFTGIVGGHKWYTGRTEAALIHMWPVWAGLFALAFFIASALAGIPCPCACTLLIPAPFMQALSMVEGVIYLTLTDEEFHKRYMIEKRGWF